MKTRPLLPAHILWADDGLPYAPDYADRYHAPYGALAQARQVFLAGNGLPERWAGRQDFTICETGFGLGNNFLATWQAWRDDPQRPARLHYVAVEAHPPAPADLARAHAACATQAEADLAQVLQRAWPVATAGLHLLQLDRGAVRLLLALGDVRACLPELVFQADAFYLDGFDPAHNPAMWDPHVIKALGRRARPGATAATWSVARAVRDALSAAGFSCERVDGIGGKRRVLQARYEPRPGMRTRPAHAAATEAGGSEARALVLGAGLAGACTAAALAAQGYAVQVLDARAAPAQASSGNPAGLYHATVHADDGPHARLFRAAALHTSRLLASLDPARVPHHGHGLLRLEHDLALPAMQAVLQQQALPPDFVQALSADDAAAKAGVPVAGPAWWFASGGWASPAHLVQERLASHPAIHFRGHCAVAAIHRHEGQWQALDAQGQCLAQAPHLVLANAEQAGVLLQAAGWPAWPWQRSRGQVTWFQPDQPHSLLVPVAGDGYVLPLPPGAPAGPLLCGATVQEGDDDPALRLADHQHNLDRLQRLCGLQAPPETSRWHGRVGWRAGWPDRLPAAGPVPVPQPAAGTRLDQARLVPRMPGLHVAAGFGARGLTLAPLLAELVACRISGSPLPLPQSLVDAVDPARVLVREARRATRPGAAPAETR